MLPAPRPPPALLLPWALGSTGLWHHPRAWWAGWEGRPGRGGGCAPHGGWLRPKGDGARVWGRGEVGAWVAPSPLGGSRWPERGCGAPGCPDPPVCALVSAPTSHGSVSPSQMPLRVGAPGRGGLCWGLRATGPRCRPTPARLAPTPVPTGSEALDTPSPERQSGRLQRLGSWERPGSPHLAVWVLLCSPTPAEPGAPRPGAEPTTYSGGGQSGPLLPL